MRTDGDFMVTKQGTSPKVKNAGRHAKRGIKPGDTVVSRTKRRTGAPRIAQGETLFEQIANERRKARSYTAGPKATLPTKPTQAEAAKLIFLEKVTKPGSARYVAGMLVLTHFATAKSEIVNGHKLTRTAVAMSRAKTDLPADITSDPARKAAADKGMQIAFAALSEAWEQLNPSAKA